MTSLSWWSPRQCVGDRLCRQRGSSRYWVVTGCDIVRREQTRSMRTECRFVLTSMYWEQERKNVDADIQQNATWHGFRIYRNPITNNPDLSLLEWGRLESQSKSQLLTCYLMATVILLSVTGYWILCSRNTHYLDLDSGTRSNVSANQKTM